MRGNAVIKSLEYYYQAEMELLDVALQNFARQHPDVAGRMKLDSRSRDPHIELLLHGSAYLQARVKEQIDLGVHHVSESLLRHLAPQYLMPRPSKTIVEFSSLKNQLIFPEIIPAGVRACHQSTHTIIATK